MGAMEGPTHRVEDLPVDGKIQLPRRRKKPGSGSRGPDLVKAFERVSLPVWAWVTHFNFLQEDFAGTTRALRAPAESSV